MHAALAREFGERMGQSHAALESAMTDLDFAAAQSRADELGESL